MKRVLMVAFHFPPLAGSSGIQRTLRFARFLPRFGWEPLVLTAHPRAYARVSQDQSADVDPDTVVERAFAVDAARHLSVAGRYPQFLARPDRWASWWPGAVLKGRSMIRRFRPAVIWSTFPIATAHRIGHSLQRASGLPWVADFRDPMAQDGHPPDPRTWRQVRRIEERAIRDAQRCVVVTPGARRFYRAQYPDTPADHFAVIENGYDDEVFGALEGPVGAPAPLVPGRLTLLHSGLIYPRDRDPTTLFAALRRMIRDGLIARETLLVRLRAPGREPAMRALIAAHELDGIVEIAPAIPYREALLEMMRADGLLVLQSRHCNSQIPAKAYEYLRSGRPVLALTDPAGDTAEVLRRAGVDALAPLDGEEQIIGALQRFIANLRGHVQPRLDAEYVDAASRLNRTRELAQLLDEVSVGGG